MSTETEKKKIILREKIGKLEIEMFFSLGIFIFVLLLANAVNHNIEQSNFKAILQAGVLFHNILFICTYIKLRLERRACVIKYKDLAGNDNEEK